MTKNEAARQAMDFAHGNLAASSHHRPDREAFRHLWAERGLPLGEFETWAKERELGESSAAAPEPAKVQEWTRPQPDMANAARGLYYRLRLSYDPGDPIRLTEEQVTSESAQAKPLEDGERETIHLLADEVRWLHRVLGEVVELLGVK